MTILKKNLFLLILFLLGAIRFVNLKKIPIFGDEALTLYLVDNILQNPNSLFDSINWSVLPISIWVHTLYRIISLNLIDVLILGRSLLIICDFLAVFTIYLIAKKLFDLKSAMLSSLIYLSLPLNFFHSRLVLIEAMVNLFFCLIILQTIKFFKSENINKQLQLLKILFLSFLLNLAYFTKPIIVAVLPVIFLIPFFNKMSLFLNPKNKNRFYLINLIALFIISLSFIYLIYLPISYNFTSKFVVNQNQPFDQIIHNFKTNLWRIFWWTNVYLTIPIILLIFVSTIFGFIAKNKWSLWCVTALITTILAQAFFSAHFFPRHLFILSPSISLLIGSLLFNIKIIPKKIIYTLICLSLIPSWILNYKIITKPDSAPIALEDKQQFFEDWPSGEGSQQIAQKLAELSKNKNITVFVENEPSQTWVFGHYYKIPNATIIPSNELFKGQFITTTSINNNSYLIINKNQGIAINWPVDLIYAYPKGPNRYISIYKIRI